MNSGVPPLALAPGMPRDADGPVFNAPWEAQAFAMTLALHERGLFTWSEWAEVLAAQIAAAQAAGDPDTGNTYYRHWLAALESLVARKGASSKTNSRVTATPGTMRPTARRTGSRSSCAARTFPVRRESRGPG